MPPRMALSWTASLVRVVVDASGTYSLPYSEMRVILPRDANGGIVRGGRNWAAELKT